MTITKPLQRHIKVLDRKTTGGLHIVDETLLNDGEAIARRLRYMAGDDGSFYSPRYLEVSGPKMKTSEIMAIMADKLKKAGWRRYGNRMEKAAANFANLGD